MVAAFADVRGNAALGHEVVEFEECMVPGLDMCVVGIDEGAVQIENHRGDRWWCQRDVLRQG
jgi:hypothetical protein